MIILGFFTILQLIIQNFILLGLGQFCHLHLCLVIRYFESCDNGFLQILFRDNHTATNSEIYLVYMVGLSSQAQYSIFSSDVFSVQAMINTSTVDVFDNEYEDRYDGQPVKEIDVLQGGEAMYVLTEKKVSKYTM